MLQKEITSGNFPQILFQDDYFMVLNKPAGWVVNDAQTTKEIQTVQQWLKNNFDFPLAKDEKMRNGIVHRLDKETSGLLLVAKTADSFYNLTRQFKERRVKKSYLALVHGWFKEKDGVVSASVGRNPFNREKFGVFIGGKEAKTNYHVLDQVGSGDERLSLVKLWPETGRTHQIRVHMKYTGHSLVGDDKYAGGKTARRDRAWCPRVFLHASSLDIFHPKTNTFLHFFATLPPDLEKVLQAKSLHFNKADLD